MVTVWCTGNQFISLYQFCLSRYFRCIHNYTNCASCPFLWKAQHLRGVSTAKAKHLASPCTVVCVSQHTPCAVVFIHYVHSTAHSGMYQVLNIYSTQSSDRNLVLLIRQAKSHLTKTHKLFTCDLHSSPLSFRCLAIALCCSSTWKPNRNSNKLLLMIVMAYPLPHV